MSMPCRIVNKHWLWLLLILFWPVPAFAQYFYIETEHDWSVMTREGAWGVRQIVVQPGEMRRTTIHLGPRVYCTRLRAAEIAALALGPMVLAAAVAMSRWRRKTSPERNS
jgi:hypothetical protein